MFKRTEQEFIAWIEGTEREARCYLGKGGVYTFTPETAHRYKSKSAAKGALTRAHKAYHRGHAMQRSGWFCTSQLHLYT